MSSHCTARQPHPLLQLRSLAVFIGGLLLLLLPTFGEASSEALLRERFLQAEALAKQGKLAPNDSLLVELRAYPLYPYLEYQRLAAKGSALSRADFERFAAQYPDLHLTGMLRFQLVRVLGEQQAWGDYRDYFTKLERPDTPMECLYGRALLADNQPDSAWQLARQLWQQGQSQPKECDPLFSALRSAGRLDSELATERVLAALEAGNLGLAQYAERFVSDARLKELVEAAQSVYNTPNRIIELSPRYRKSEYLARMQAIAVQRSYRKDPYQAVDLIIRLGKLYLTQYPQPLKQLERAGVRIAKELNPNDLALLDKLDPGFRSSALTEWRIRLALRIQDWSAVSRFISRLPETEQASGRWQYWQAVAESHSGNRQILDELATERSFYGFLAADIQGRKYQMNQQSPRFTEALNARLRTSPEMGRIRELVALDRFSVARSEWNQWIEPLSTQERQAAAHLMQELDWYQMGILAAAYEGFWDDLVLRFPSPHFDLFSQESAARDIDPLWSLAISRQESALFRWARSSAGARGLMQLMPRTASHTAKSASILYQGTPSLYHADVNIKLGTAYLAQMLRRFDGNRVYATAAYNAGPHRVDRWLSNSRDLPLDIWIETIPYDETRTYVQNVLSFALIYADLKAIPRTLLTEKERGLLFLAAR